MIIKNGKTYLSYHEYYKSRGWTNPKPKNTENRILSLPDNVKPIPGFPTYYASPEGDIYRKHISNRGRYPSKNPKIIKLKHQIQPTGYCVVQPFQDGKKRIQYVHRLVLSTFKGTKPKGWECDHIDCNPQNNNIENLRWLTKEDNLKRIFDKTI